MSRGSRSQRFWVLSSLVVSKASRLWWQGCNGTAPKRSLAALIISGCWTVGAGARSGEGTLTGEERSGSGALPSFAQGQVSRRAGLVQKAATDWKNALVDLGGRNNLLHYRDLKRGTLDLTAADRDAVGGLLRGKA